MQRHVRLSRQRALPRIATILFLFCYLFFLLLQHYLFAYLFLFLNDDESSLLTSVREAVVPGASVRVLSFFLEFEQQSFETRSGIVQQRIQRGFGILSFGQALEEKITRSRVTSIRGVQMEAFRETS